MASPATMIPPFLLPRLSWQPITPCIALSNLSQRCVHQASSQFTHGRSMTSKARARQKQRFPKGSCTFLPPHSLKPIRNSTARAFSTTLSRPRDHHFDTLKFVQRLQAEGFSEEQSKAMMLVLSDVIEESIQNLTRTMVLKEDADRSTYTQKVDFTKLRSELLALDSSDTSMTLASHERLSNDLAKLNSRLRDEVNRAQASVRLDLNLEKGRIREEAKGQELKIKETETRIEQEVAGLRERVEGVKFSTLQWLM
ncbi:hypothetical protein MMC21_004560 [Puttea exsequens]|nr:hypothetical protein [Puttea exsequens]